MGGGGLAATLRDMARFGEMLRCEGSLRGRQIVPASVVADIRRGSDRGKFAKAGYTLLGGYSYRDMWWVTHNEHHAFEARGITASASTSLPMRRWSSPGSRRIAIAASAAK